MQIQTLVLCLTLKTGISACSLKHVRTAGERPWLQGKSKFCRAQFVIKTVLVPLNTIMSWLDHRKPSSSAKPLSMTDLKKQKPTVSCYIISLQLDSN